MQRFLQAGISANIPARAMSASEALRQTELMPDELLPHRYKYILVLVCFQPQLLQL
jgi:hypothetical protein